jgi:parallel beta-helix repeat protein
VELSEGQFNLGATLTMPSKPVHLHGQGPVVSELFLQNGESVNMISVPSQLCTISDLSLNGNKANQTTTGNGIVVTHTKVVLRNLWITETEQAGILIDGASSPTAHANKIVDCYVTLCGGNGITIADFAHETEIANVWSGDNGGHGIEIQSEGCRIIQCNCWGADSTNDGIRVTASVRTQIIGCILTTNGGAGIRTTGGSSGTLISGCNIKGNGTQGVYAFNSDKCTFTGNVVTNNASTGLRLDTSDDWAITGNVFYDDQGGKTQDYAIDDGGSASTGHVIVGNLLKAADHQTGSINLTSSTRIVKNNNDASDFPVTQYTVEIILTDPAGSDLTTGDGKGYYIIPSLFNGLNLLTAHACLIDPATGSTTVMVHNVTQAADMLSAAITIDTTEQCSYTGTAGTVDTGNDDVATGDLIRFDLDTVGTTAKGLTVILTFGL